jgi:hypothetical protein
MIHAENERCFVVPLRGMPVRLPCIPLHISQWPLAIQTRTLEPIGII